MQQRSATAAPLSSKTPSHPHVMRGSVPPEARAGHVLIQTKHVRDVSQALTTVMMLQNGTDIVWTILERGTLDFITSTHIRRIKTDIKYLQTV